MTALPAITTPLDATPHTFTDAEARADLSQHGKVCGAKPDAYWARRWAWRDRLGRLDIEGVIRLRLGGARDAALPKDYARHLQRAR